MTSPRSRSPGRSPHDASAATLLGVPAGAITREAVEVSLRRRLAELDAMPQRTPLADQERLELCVAAAQLADERVGGHLSSLRKARPAQAAISPADESMLAAIRDILGASGGWNARARRRLLLWSGRTGLDTARLVRLVAASVPRAGADATTAPDRGAARGAHPLGTTSSSSTRAGSAPILAAAVLGALVVLVPGTRRVTADPNADQIPAAVSVDSSAQGLPPPDPRLPARRLVLDEPELVRRELLIAAKAAPQRPSEATDRFVAAVVALGDVWPRTDPGEFADLLAVARQSRAAIESVPGGSALGARLSQIGSGETDADALSQRLAARAVLGDGEPSVLLRDAGAALPEDNGAAWQRWAMMWRPLASPAEAEDAAMDALARLARDAGASSDALRVVAALSPWRPGSPAAAWLRSALGDASIDDARASALVRAAAATGSPLLPAGVAELPMDAAARLRLRHAMRSDAAAALPPVATEFRAALASALAASDRESGPARVAAALDFLRLADAAAALGSGDEASAASALGAVGAAGLTPVADGESPPDGALADALASASDPAAQILAIERGAAKRLGRADATVLVEAMLRAPARSVRSAALSTLDLRSGDVEVAIALADAADALPRSDEVAALVRVASGRSIEADDARTWRQNARAALLADATARLGPSAAPVRELLVALAEDRPSPATASVRLAVGTARDEPALGPRYAAAIAVASAEASAAASPPDLDAEVRVVLAAGRADWRSALDATAQLLAAARATARLAALRAGVSLDELGLAPRHWSLHPAALAPAMSPRARALIEQAEAAADGANAPEDAGSALFAAAYRAAIADADHAAASAAAWAMASLTSNPDEARRWHLVAAALDPRRVVPASAPASADSDDRLDAAALLRAVRRGDGPGLRVASVRSGGVTLAAPLLAPILGTSPDKALERARALADGAACRVCGRRSFTGLPTAGEPCVGCHGVPAPDLSPATRRALLLAELSLLDPSDGSWDAAGVAGRAGPVVLTLPER